MTWDLPAIFDTSNAVKVPGIKAGEAEEMIHKCHDWRGRFGFWME
jgi:hypothetical protein